MTSVQENSGEAEANGKEEANARVNKENGDAAPSAEDNEQGNDKGDTELEIQNNEDDLEALVDDDEEKDRPRRRSWDRMRGREKKSSRERDRERERDRNRRRSRSPERSSNKREPSRRDPSKSCKDIEQDKARAKKDNDSKALAEKEKAIKTLLDSNDVVPPGTEEEAIQIICEKNQEQSVAERKRSRDNNRSKRSPIHSRLGPRCRISPRRRTKSPIRYSPRRKSPSPDFRRRRGSPGGIGFEFVARKRSIDRDASSERRDASRRRLRDRRDRSRDRHRSRSMDRGRRSRSYDRRRSRSFDRRRRSRSYDRSSPPPRRRRSTSRSRSPTRPRRRSPFINELARQFSVNEGPLGPTGGGGEGGGCPPGLLLTPYIIGPGAGPPLDPRMMPGPGPGGPPPGMMGGPMPDMPPVGPMDIVHPIGPMHPGGPPMMQHQPPFPGPFDPFDPLRGGGGGGPDYGPPGPVLYGQPPGMPLGAPMPRPISPQPVPAPGLPMYPAGMMQPIGSAPVPAPNHSPMHEERIRTPEPPIISDFKLNEKTSLSSLLEASVTQSTIKDTSSSMPTFKGFKPEVIRQCERALRSLPTEDPRLTMKGRFFFDPNKKLVAKENADIVPTSNSILLRKGRTEIHWDEEYNQLNQATELKSVEGKRVITLQKICQTEEPTSESIAVQTEESMRIDFGMQVVPDDLMTEEDRRRAMAMANNVAGNAYDERRNNYDDSRRNFDERSVGSGRPDWNMRDGPYEHGNNQVPMRDNEDLRWSLSNNPNRMNAWPRNDFSPPRQSMHGGPVGGPGMDFRNMEMMRGMDGQMMDARERLMDRGVPDFRDRDLDMRGGMDMPRERELMMDMRGDGGGGRGMGPMGGMMDMGGAGGMGDFGRDDFDMRNRIGDGFGRGPMNMDRGGPMNRGRNSPPVGPVGAPMDDDLEIIEERLYDRDSWQRMGNARGGAPAMRGPFHGGRMVGSFRPNF